MSEIKSRIIELKAMAYDAIARIESSKKELDAINNEIIKLNAELNKGDGNGND